MGCKHRASVAPLHGNTTIGVWGIIDPSEGSAIGVTQEVDNGQIVPMSTGEE